MKKKGFKKLLDTVLKFVFLFSSSENMKSRAMRLAGTSTLPR